MRTARLCTRNRARIQRSHTHPVAALNLALERQQAAGNAFLECGILRHGGRRGGRLVAGASRRVTHAARRRVGHVLLRAHVTHPIAVRQACTSASASTTAGTTAGTGTRGGTSDASPCSSEEVVGLALPSNAVAAAPLWCHGSSGDAAGVVTQVRHDAEEVAWRC